MKKLYEKIYAQIKAYIIDHQLREGDKLPVEAELCQMFGVSRNALREALKALQFMGVLDASPGIGYTVRSFNYDGVLENLMFYLATDVQMLRREVTDVRDALEIYFFDEAFDALDSDDLQALCEAVRQMESSVHNAQDFAKADERFHRTIFRRVKNTLFQSLLSTAWHTELTLVQLPEAGYEETARSHYEIYRAICDENREEAKRILIQHFAERAHGKAHYGY